MGDHGCEYMTGGRVVILGKTGRNFAAGMSGGIAYVYDINGDFKNKCNMEMVALETVAPEDELTITDLLHNHHKYTGSPIARRILDNFSRGSGIPPHSKRLAGKEELKRFVKVMPLEYKRIIEQKKLEQKMDLTEVSD